MTKQATKKHTAPKFTHDLDKDGKLIGVYAVNTCGQRVMIPIGAFERNGLKPGFKFAKAPNAEKQITDIFNED